MDDLPLAFAVAQNEPNPFTRLTHVRLTAPQSAPWRFTIYSITGRRVWEDSGVAPTGTTQLSWDGRDMDHRRCAPGVYLYRVELAGHRVTRRMALIP